jgi:hypothetical protein
MLMLLDHLVIMVFQMVGLLIMKVMSLIQIQKTVNGELVA